MFNLKKFLLQEMKRNKITKKALAQESKLHYNTVRYYFNDKIQLRSDNLQKLFDALAKLSRNRK